MRSYLTGQRFLIYESSERDVFFVNIRHATQRDTTGIITELVSQITTTWVRNSPWAYLKGVFDFASLPLEVARPVNRRVWITLPFQCVREICLYILTIIAGNNTPRFQQSVKEMKDKVIFSIFLFKKDWFSKRNRLNWKFYAVVRRTHFSCTSRLTYL